MPASPAPAPARAALQRCPLCGQDNQCAMERLQAQGELAPPCWCTLVQIPPEQLRAVPPDSQGRVCLCPACAGSAPA